MKIAVLSGKGGTGKTLVSINLASVCKDSVYADCDVEEPNGHIFFKPHVHNEKDINVLIPYCDDVKCNACKACVQFCNFNALAYVGNRLMVFEDICHSCGGCKLVCPENAINEKDKQIGVIQTGTSMDTTVITGIMNTGEESGVPIINQVLETAWDEPGDLIIDCPPGSSCSVMESIKDSDYCILVTEPTVLGLHDFTMVYELVSIFNKPFGVVLNKCTKEHNPAKEFCLENDLNILAEIPYDKDLGYMNSDGEIVSRETMKYRMMFESLYEKITEEVSQ